MAALVASGVTGASAWWLAGTGTASFIVGITDDLIRLKPSTKLTSQIGIACSLLAAGWSLTWTDAEPLNVIITILWFVGVTNAFNLLDNMDGVCAGVAFIAAIGYALGPLHARPDTTAYASAMAGATLGFLLYNFQPASIFMGDSGSLFIGTSFATLTIIGGTPARTGILSTVAVPTLLLLIPIFDTAYVTLVRKLSARSASIGGRDHTSHRLVALGFSERQTALFMYALTAAGAGCAVLLQRSHFAGMALSAVVVLCLVLIAVFLSGVKVYGGEDFTLLRDRRYTQLLVDITYKRRVFEVLLDLCLIVVSYYAAYLIRFDDQFGANYPMFARSLPIVIACQLISFFIAGVYRGMWTYIGLSDIVTYVRAIAFGTLSSMTALLLWYRFAGFSRMAFVIDAMVLGMLMVGSRASFRLMRELANKYRPTGERTLIYGAGAGGAMVLRELRSNERYGANVVGFLDDDQSKKRRRILGVPVLGGLEQLEDLIAAQRIELVVVSTTKIPPQRLELLQALCYGAGVRLLRLQFNLQSVDSSPSPQSRGL